MSGIDRGEIYLTTDRLILRALRPEDASLLHDLDSDRGVLRYLSRERPSLAHIRDVFLPRILRDYDAYPGFGYWKAQERRTGDFLGWFELSVGAPDERLRPQLGYRLRRTAWGRGLATEGGRALVDKAFSELGVEAVYAQTMAVNDASRRVMEKCGLHHVRTFHVPFDDPLPGSELGEVEYEIRRDDWMRRHHG